MLRQVIKPTSEFYNVHIPKEYINHDIEIMILPLFELESTGTVKSIKKSFDPQSFYGIASSDKKSIDKYLQENKSEWE
jgi:hypothetical protein